MKQFSIKDLERFTQIKAYTIRTWEKRYDILNPQRSIANIRSYTLSDVTHLLDVSLLVHHGYKISKIVKMESSSIESTIASFNSEELKNLVVINQLIVCMYAANIAEFEIIIDDSIESLGLDVTIKKVILPFLEKVQLLSYKDNSFETHFVVTVIRKKLILGIEKITASSSIFKTVLLFLPKDEHYDLLLLYMTYVIKGLGYSILYLGTNISKTNFELVLKSKKLDYLYTYIPSMQNFKVDEYSSFLNDHFPTLSLFVAQPEPNTIQIPNYKNVRCFYYKLLDKTLLYN